MSNTSNLVALKEGNNPSQDALSLFLYSNLCQVSSELVNQVRIINTWKLQGVGGSLVNVTGIQLCCHQDFSRPSHDSLTPFPFPFSNVQQSETNFPKFLKIWFPGFWRENFNTTCSTLLPFRLSSGDKPCSFWTTVAWGSALSPMAHPYGSACFIAFPCFRCRCDHILWHHINKIPFNANLWGCITCMCCHHIRVMGKLSLRTVTWLAVSPRRIDQHQNHLCSLPVLPGPTGCSRENTYCQQ